MSDIFFLVLRKLRTPLIVLISVYALATLGMTLIPGVDDNGEPWHMSFFHAFYFVSFMGTTIGFGEIPYEFTDAQRAWVLVCIYISVISWLYAIGTMLTLAQDPTFRNAISNRAFERSIRRINAPFHIICGFGSTGALINSGLNNLNIRTVIIDSKPDRSNNLELLNLTIAPIVLTGDATMPRSLIAAGIHHRHCRGVIAVTEDDHTNLHIALTSKLLNKSVPVICRSEIEDEANNMASFGTDVIINPYVSFARNLNLLAHNPTLHQLQNWLINQQHATHLNTRRPPEGLWIICGYGRLGKAIHHHLKNTNIKIVIVDPHPKANMAPEETIVGRGTEASTLQQAGIMQASVVIAASNDDANNLSVLITAKQLNCDIYSIGRVSIDSNETLFVKANCDYVVRSSQIIANQVLTTISRPLVTSFLKSARQLTDTQLEALETDIQALTADSDASTSDVATWRLIIDEQHSPAIYEYMQNGYPLTLEQLSQNEQLPQSRCLPLLMLRNGINHLLPANTTKLEKNDQILFCGNRNHTFLPQQMRDNLELIDSLINRNPRYIPLLRWLSRRNKKQQFNKNNT